MCLGGTQEVLVLLRGAEGRPIGWERVRRVYGERVGMSNDICCAVLGDRDIEL